MSDKRHGPPDRRDAAQESGDPPSTPAPEASERLLQVEGADGPQRSPRRRRRRPRSGRSRPRSIPQPAREAPDEQTTREAQAPPTGPEAQADLATRIRELEARLDTMIVAHARERDAGVGADDAAPRRAGVDADRPSDPGAGALSRTPPPLASPHTSGARASAREFLSTDFYLRQWGRLGLRNRSEEVDEFGYDPVYEQRLQPVFDFLYDKYFRVEVHGMGHVPGEGRCLLVANHSGVLPVDGVMLRLAVRREHPEHRNVRWLAEDAVFHFPFLGSFTNRIGAVRACQENAERLLGQGALVAVFPEGTKGIGKPFRQRYKLQRFGRGGFVKLCLRTRTPVVPVAIVGSEEANPVLARIEYLTKVLGVPFLPVTPTFPLLGPVGLLPAPTKWKVFFGEALALDGYGAEASEDEILVGRLAERVRGEIQAMLDRALAERRSVWFG
ncbi:MAG TPA: lysophospholipid acyltransferase family protein [Polyangiaceae bacterium]|nr:lysophospholipid acyltransferase family protein [Polyangiaceae bacterium]